MQAGVFATHPPELVARALGERRVRSNFCKIKFIEKIRSEKRFDSFDELKNQISADLAWAKLYLAQVHITSQEN
jgi:hypothetical protein